MFPNLSCPAEWKIQSKLKIQLKTQRKSGQLSLTNIPKLKPNDRRLVPVQNLQRKINSNRCSVVLAEELMNISFDEGGFPCSKFAWKSKENQIEVTTTPNSNSPITKILYKCSLLSGEFVIALPCKNNSRGLVEFPTKSTKLFVELEPEPFDRTS
jgi:hypothetical protein